MEHNKRAVHTHNTYVNIERVYWRLEARWVGTNAQLCAQDATYVHGIDTPTLKLEEKNDH